MKILVITPYFPHPLVGHGGSEYVYGLVKYLMERNEVTVISFLDEHEATLVDDLKGFPITMRLIPRDKGKQKGIVRLMQLTFLRFFQLLRSIILWEPYYVSKYYDSRMVKAIQEETARTNFDAVQIEFTQMAQYVSLVKTGTTVLRSHDAVIRPWERMYKNATHIFNKFIFYLEYRRWLSYEPRIIRQFDHVLTFTEDDARFLRSVAKTEKVKSHPRGIEVPDQIVPYAEKEPNSLLFVGVYNHIPNRDAVIWLCSEVFPAIQKRCQHAVLYVLGKHAPDEILALAKENSNLKILGFVPKIEDYLNRASVFIAPIRLGGGIKTKILQAQSYGLSVVSTTIGVEGITSATEKTVLTADTVEGLAECVETLLNNKEQAATMADEGHKLVVAQYAWKSVIKELEMYYRVKHYGNPTGTKK